MSITGSTPSHVANSRTRPIKVGIEAIGLIGPGLPDWGNARAVLAGVRPWTAARTVASLPAILPPAERRRSSQAVRLALAAGHQAMTDSAFRAQDLVTVFASSGSDGANCHAICETLASADRSLSPTRFHNSVHNAASGYWGIAVGARPSSTSLCAHDGSFATGWLEALTLVHTHDAPVLLVVYDAGYPEPLLSERPIDDDFAVAIVLTPPGDVHARAIIGTQIGDEAPTVLADPAIESMRRGIPTARCLPLLQAVAGGVRAQRIVIDYLPAFLGTGSQSLAMQVTDPPPVRP